MEFKTWTIILGLNNSQLQVHETKFIKIIFKRNSVNTANNSPIPISELVHQQIDR